MTASTEVDREYTNVYFAPFFALQAALFTMRISLWINAINQTSEIADTYVSC